MDAGRQAIVDALATVDGLAPSPAQPSSIVAGSAWPVRTRMPWLNHCATLTEWSVYVALPNGHNWATVEEGDAVAHEIGTALWQVGRVLEAAPYEIPVEPGQQAIPVLRYLMEV